MDTTFAELLIFPEGASEAVAVIRNPTHEPVVIEQARSSAPFFIVGAPVAADGVIRVTIRFAPESPGTYARLVDVGGTAFLCQATTEGAMGDNDGEWITSMPPRSLRSRITSRSRRSWRGSPADTPRG
jgi:hypothetical protein